MEIESCPNRGLKLIEKKRREAAVDAIVFQGKMKEEDHVLHFATVKRQAREWGKS